MRTEAHVGRERPAPKQLQAAQTSPVIPVLTAIAVAAAMFGAFVGSGAFGGQPIKDAAGGWLGADSTLLAPGTGAFAIWTLIYAGLGVYAVWQLGSAARASAVQRRIRPLAAASAILNAVWIVVVQSGWLGISAVVILVLLAVLAWLIRDLIQSRPVPPVERWISGVVFGAYLGWVSVAAVANIAAWLAFHGVGRDAGWAEPLAVLLVFVAVLIGAATVVFSGGRTAAALAMAWGIAWIGIGRSDGGNLSEVVAVAAWVGAGLLLAFTVGASLWIRRKQQSVSEAGA